MRTHCLIACAALLTAGAQALPAQQPRDIVPSFGLSVGSMSTDSAAAAQSQVGNRSWGLQLDAGMLMKRFLYVGVDIGGQFLRDKARFTQNTTGGEMKSTAAVTYLSLITGIRTGTLPVVPVALALNAGASKSIGRRSIDNCSDCHVDKLSIPGGAFVEPTLLLGRKNVRMRVTDRVYLGGEGIRNVISVGADLMVVKR